MKPITFILCTLSFAGSLAAGPLEDLRAFLLKHPGHSPIHLRVSGEFGQAEERRNKPVATLPSLPVNLRLSDTSAGFQITWDSSTLQEAAERNPAEDLGMSLPNLAHASTTWLDPICLAKISNPVRSLQRLLEVAELKTVRQEAWGGTPAQRLEFRFKSPVPERYRHRANTTDGTLILWVASDGAPLASETTLRYKGKLSRFFGDFSRMTTQKAIYALGQAALQDRLYARSQRIEDHAVAEWDTTRTLLDLKVEEVPASASPRP